MRQLLILRIKTSEVCAIYSITPSSNMSEYCGHQNPDRIIIIMGSDAGAIGDLLYMDVVNMIAEEWQGEKLKFTAGHYGLASKEFTLAMVKSIYDELKKDQPRKHFTIGIDDDVTHTSLNYDKSFLRHPENCRKRSNFLIKYSL